MLCKCFAGYVKAKLTNYLQYFLCVMNVSNDMKNMGNALEILITVLMM